MLGETPGVVVLAILVYALGGAVFALVALNALAGGVVGLLRLRAGRRAPTAAAMARLAPRDPRPFISIHVPAHDEPADLLVETIDALARLDYEHFEVLLLDNNTPDPQVWRPIEAHCRALGPRFRFAHLSDIKGAKAGALNIGLQMMRPDAAYVAIVDADYQVEPDFLTRAVEAMARSGADYVQFPQAYRHGPGAAPVAHELADYFRTFAPAANPSASMLLTGTLSVVSADWLRHVGGWPTATVTEDAHLGLSLCLAGARGIFVPAIVGRGILPLDFAGLDLQRSRWVSGNAQTLMHALPALRTGVGRRSTLSILSQLTAWPAFAAVPALALLATAGLGLVTALPAAWDLVRITAALSLAGTLAALVFETVVMKRQPATLVVRLAMLWTASLAWIPALWGWRFRFLRTPKRPAGDAGLPRLMLAAAPLILLGGALLWQAGAPLAALALQAPLLSLPSALRINRMLATAPARREMEPTCAA